MSPATLDTPTVEIDLEEIEEYYDFSVEETSKMGELLDRMDEADTVEDWSFILKDHVSFGNSKLEDEIAVFNMNSATDCPNLGEPSCQVSKDECYAFQSENLYNQPLPYRRRQTVLWDAIDGELWAAAFRKAVSRMRNEVTTIRFSEAGDFRSNGDIKKVDKIAETLEEFDVYTYSASESLDWDLAENFIVNASNERQEYGDQKYKAVPTEEDIPESGIHCPYEASDKEIACGDCRLCITGAPSDIYITIHT